MKILVCGGRDYNNQFYVFYILNKLDKQHNITCVIDGKATGADTLANKWARLKNKQFKRFPSDWKRYGNKAGHIRNKQMLDENPDIQMVVAFQGGRGTQDMLNQSVQRDIKIKDFRNEVLK